LIFYFHKHRFIFDGEVVSAQSDATHCNKVLQALPTSFTFSQHGMQWWTKGWGAQGKAEKGPL